MTPFLEVRNLSRSFGRTRALDQVSVAISPGAVHGFIGPNGSGKSNIADAILFALGENSPRTLRAAQGRLTGLIYDPKKEADAAGGTHEEKPPSCRVSIQFDNADRKIPVDSDTVTVTRELRSDGENSYYLNGKKNPKGVIADLLDVVVVEHQRLRRDLRRDSGRRGITEGECARARFHQQEIAVPVIAAFELHDLGAAGKPTRQADRAHRRFGA